MEEWINNKILIHSYERNLLIKVLIDQVHGLLYFLCTSDKIIYPLCSYTCMLKTVYVQMNVLLTIVLNHIEINGIDRKKHNQLTNVSVQYFGTVNLAC